MDWQTELKTSPIRLQSSSLVQSCQGEKHQLQSTNVSGRIRQTKTRTNLYFHHSVGHIQVPQTGDRDSSSLLTKAESISRYGDAPQQAMLGLNELHLLVRFRSCTDGGLNFTVVFKTVQPVKAQHETRRGHLPADTHQLPHAHKGFTMSACCRHSTLNVSCMSSGMRPVCPFSLTKLKRASTNSWPG